MQELFREAIAAPNLFYTILLGFVLLYFLSVFIGALDLDLFDFDLEADFDLDVEVDADLELEVDAEMEGEIDTAVSPGFWISTLSFFNLGKVPFMIFFSLLVLSMWVIGLIANHHYAGVYSWFAPAFILPNFLVSLFIAKFLSEPFKKSFSKMNQEGISKLKTGRQNVCSPHSYQTRCDRTGGGKSGRG